MDSSYRIIVINLLTLNLARLCMFVDMEFIITLFSYCFLLFRSDNTRLLLAH